MGKSTSQGTVTLTGAAPTAGISVTLSSSNTSAATVPASVTVASGSTTATFTVSTSSQSSDATANITATYSGTSKSAALTVTASNLTNIALNATATASSQTPAYQQTAAKAIDGVADGYPGDYTNEWATNGEKAGAWIQLDWTQNYTVNTIRLYDRPNTYDQITSATLTFSDGTSMSVGALNNDGSAVDISIGGKSIRWVRLIVNSVGSNTANVGLSEFEVY
jgi:hypothetical protein